MDASTRNTLIAVLLIFVVGCSEKEVDRQPHKVSPAKDSVKKSQPEADNRSGEMFLSFDPLPKEPRVELRLPRGRESSSVVWLEPGPRAGTIRLIFATERIPKDAVRSLGLTEKDLPQLKLEFDLQAGPDGVMQAAPLLGPGTKYWGAAQGPVLLAGKLRRNLHGAVVWEKWVKLSHFERTQWELEQTAKRPALLPVRPGTSRFKFEPMKHIITLSPPCLAENSGN